MDENCTMKRRENGLYSVRVKNGKGVVIAKADNIPFQEAVALIENTMYTEDDNRMIIDKSNLHEQICKELTDIYRRKNHDYGDSFHLTFEKWGLPMAAIRLSDKLQRFETLIRSESQVDESIRDTLIDLANYAIMTVIELDMKA